MKPKTLTTGTHSSVPLMLSGARVRSSRRMISTPLSSIAMDGGGDEHRRTRLGPVQNMHRQRDRRVIGKLRNRQVDQPALARLYGQPSDDERPASRPALSPCPPAPPGRCTSAPAGASSSRSEKHSSPITTQLWRCLFHVRSPHEFAYALCENRGQPHGPSRHARLGALRIAGIKKKRRPTLAKQARSLHLGSAASKTTTSAKRPWASLARDLDDALSARI